MNRSWIHAACAAAVFALLTAAAMAGGQAAKSLDTKASVSRGGVDRNIQRALPTNVAGRPVARPDSKGSAATGENTLDTRSAVSRGGPDRNIKQARPVNTPGKPAPRPAQRGGSASLLFEAR